MNKFLLLSVAITTSVLFALSAKTDTVVSSTAITFEDYQTDINKNTLNITVPTMPPFPSGLVQSQRIRSTTQLQIIVNNSPLPTRSPNATTTIKPTSSTAATSQQTSSPTVTPQGTVAPSVTATSKPTATSTPKPVSTPAPQLQQNVSFTDEVIQLVNAERSKVGLSSLAKNNNLTNSAQSYAVTMANQNFFSHTGLDGSTFVTRNNSAGYSGYKWMGENIAAGQSSPNEVMAGWMASSGHKANILNSKAKEIGVGYATNNSSKYKKYWVQEFGAR